MPVLQVYVVLRAAPIEVVKVFSSAFTYRREYCSVASYFSELRCCRDNSSSMPGSSLLVLYCFSGWVRYQFAGHRDGLLPSAFVDPKSLKVGLQLMLQASIVEQRRLWFHCQRKSLVISRHTDFICPHRRLISLCSVHPWALSSFSSLPWMFSRKASFALVLNAHTPRH